MVVLSGEMLIKEERTRNSTTSTILLHHRPPLVESQAIVKCARLRGSVSYLDAADGGGGPWLLLEAVVSGGGVEQDHVRVGGSAVRGRQCCHGIADPDQLQGQLPLRLGTLQRGRRERELASEMCFEAIVKGSVSLQGPSLFGGRQQERDRDIQRQTQEPADQRGAGLRAAERGQGRGPLVRGPS